MNKRSLISVVFSSFFGKLKRNHKVKFWEKDYVSKKKQKIFGVKNLNKKLTLGRNSKKKVFF